MKQPLALLCAALLSLAPFAAAADMQTPKPGFTQDDLPDTLKPWAKWVLSDYKPSRCPFLYNNYAQKSCVWPGDLSLKLGASGGEFTLKAQLYDEGWLALPGSEERWPQQVKAGGQSLIVSERQGRPFLFLQAGNYVITGRFAWDELPENMALPQGVGMVNLQVSDKDVRFPVIDNNATLWVKRKETETTEAERMDVKVFRHVTDSIPATVDTRLVVNISGKPREAILGKVLLDGFVPMSVESQIPARIEPDGRLRLQVRPGTWVVDVHARNGNAALDKITLSKTPDVPDLAKEEVWVFETVNYLRLVQVDGAPPIDPAQTELPQEWRGWPAYYMQPGAALSITEKKRGNSEPQPDELTLAKEWWLDFDGNGYTVRDQLEGRISQSWRLEVQPGVDLGRAAINGRDQFITQLKGADGQLSPGIEVRPGYLSLEADSRIGNARGDLSATGWKHDFRSVRGTLHLPPGWSVFHATGADMVSDSWIQRWTLLDIFMLLIVLIVMQRLFGSLIAAITAPGYVLLHHPLPEVTVTALIILGAIALLRVLPQGRFFTLVTWVRRLALFSLLLTALPFMVNHMRLALFPQLALYESFQPQLAKDRGVMGAAREGRVAGKPMRRAKAAMRAEMKKEQVAAPELQANMPEMDEAAGGGGESQNFLSSMPASPVPPAAAPVEPEYSSKPAQEIYQYDPGMQSNTGFGVSNWSGTRIAIGWNGPVVAGQEIHLWLLSPSANLLLAVVRVVLLFFIMVVLLGVPVNRKNLKELPTMAIKAFSFLLALWLVTGLPGAAHADDLPSPQMLDEMKRKLVTELEKPPTCLPGCASVSRGRIEASGDQMTILQEIHASEAVMVPLPGPLSSWRPNTIVLVDGTATTPARGGDDGYMYIPVDRGVHQIRLSGPLPTSQDTVNLNFPLKPSVLEASAVGWDVQGIRAGGKNDGTIQLLFTGEREKQQQEATLEKNRFPAFIQVERVISFGLSWQVETTVRRMTPPGESIGAEIALLPGETVTSPDVPVKDGKAFISLGPQMQEKSWTSQLAPADTLKLSAPAASDWPDFISGSEIWRLNISNLWHVTFEGIPPVTLPQDAGTNYTNAGEVVEMPSFVPWPGEALTVHAARPEGVKGQTITVDRSRVDIKAGTRALEGTLDVSLRASQGGQHVILLPGGAVLSSATLNGAPTTLSVKDNAVTLPLAPGSQNYRLVWNQPADINIRFRTPAVDLQLPSVNAETSLTLPADRWILFAFGPQMGPAVLFWGWMPVVLLAAFALGQTSLTPLRFRHWLLLLLGLTQASLPTNLIIVGWLLILGWRREQENKPVEPLLFNLRQLLIGLWTLVSISNLFSGIRYGLLGSPNMRIQGNGSSQYFLQWYQDIAAGLLPQPGVISLPVFCYRILMLLWALWLAFALLRWLQWGWKCFSAGGYWKKQAWRKTKPQDTQP